MPVPAVLGSKLEQPQVYLSISASAGESGVFGKGSGVGYHPRGGYFGLLQSHPQDEWAIACVILVERDHESVSNYAHGNYRMALSTEYVQRRLGEPPRTHHPPQAQTLGASVARPGLGMLL